MSLINDVLRDMDKRQASTGALHGDNAPLVVPEPTRKKWPPSWMLLLVVGLSLGAFGVLLLQNHFLPVAQPSPVPSSNTPPHPDAPAPVTSNVTVLSVAAPPAAPATESDRLTSPADQPAPDAEPSAATTQSDVELTLETRSQASTHPTDSVADSVTNTETGSSSPEEARLTPFPSTSVPGADEQPPPPTEASTSAATTPIQAVADSNPALVVVHLQPDTRINLRTQPNTGSRVLAIVDHTHTLTLIDSTDDFHLVSLEDGRTGWVSRQFSSLSPYSERAPALRTEPATVAPAGRRSTQSQPPPDPPRQPIRPPATAETLYRQALQALERRDSAAAETALHRALAANPSHRDALDTLATLMLRQQRHTELESLLSTLGTAHARQLHARVLAERGEHRQALAVLSSLTPSERDAATFATLGALQQLTGQHQDAAHNFRQSLAQGHTQASTWAGLAVSLEALGQDDEARRAWQAVLNSPNADPALIAHARTRVGPSSTSGDRR